MSTGNYGKSSMRHTGLTNRLCIWKVLIRDSIGIRPLSTPKWFAASSGLCIINEQTTMTMTSNRFSIIFHSPIIRKQTHPDNPLLFVFPVNCSTWWSFRKWREREKNAHTTHRFLWRFQFSIMFFFCSAANDVHQIIGGNEKAAKIKLLSKLTHTRNAIHEWMLMNVCMRANYLICASMACMSKLILDFCRLFKCSYNYPRQFIKWARFFSISSCKQKRSPTKKILSGYEWSRCSSWM